MSFILDALKKSESDRQRQSGPSLFEVKVAPPRRTLPIWAVAIAVLLGVNVIVVSWMLLRRPTEQGAARAAAAAPAPARDIAARDAAASSVATKESAADSGKTPPAAAARTSAAPVSSPTGGAAAATPSGPPAATPPADIEQGAAQQELIAPGDYAPAVEPAATRGSAASEDATAGLPLYQQVVASDGLPSLHLDLHVFAQRPQNRFVMINMHRLQEGDTLPSGVQVESIRPDGVVLSYHGTRFLLPRN
jgi:general secretion pathway protein B